MRADSYVIIGLKSVKDIVIMFVQRKNKRLANGCQREKSMALTDYRWSEAWGFNLVLGLLVVAALGSPGVAFGGDFSMLMEANDDASGGEEVFEVSFATIGDVVSNIWLGADFTLVNPAPAFSIRGHAYGDCRHHLLYETDDDSSGGSEVWIGSFPSVADIYSNHWPAGEYSTINVNSLWSVGGFAYDGAQYHVLLETNDDASAGGEVYIMSYNSLADVFSNTQASSTYSQMDITDTFSIVGFTFDGGQYHIVFETDADAGAGDEVWVSSFGSFAEVLSGGFGVLQATQINLNSTFSIAGFAGRVPIFEDGFDWGSEGDWSQ